MTLGKLVERPCESVTPQTFIDVRTSPIFDKLHSFHQTGALTAENVLNLSASYGYIDLARSKRLLDFGAGSGGPTLALTELAKLNGGSVEVVESNPRFAQDMIELGIVTPDKVHQANGIELLSSAASTDQYDLITAFMLGPDTNGGLTQQLLGASRNALQSSGKLLVTSDIGTMLTVRGVCDRVGVSYEYVAGLPLETGPIPDVLIASFDTK